MNKARVKFSIPVWLILFAFFSGCTPPVQFNEPQPAGENDLNSFPSKLTGQYLNESDSSVLTVTDKFIVQHYHSLLRTSKAELDTLYELVDDSVLINRETHEKRKVAVVGDTISGYIDVDDTLFHISDKNVLREYKGFYFLNKAYSQSWEVEMLDLDHHHLSIGTIPDKVGLEKLKNISPAAVDSTGNVNVSKEEFRKFIRDGGFYSTSEFVKLK